MKYVVLAEKPDQAKKYAHALGQATNEKGAWKVKTDQKSHYGTIRERSKLDGKY